MAVKPVLYPMRGWSARRFRANWLCSRSFQRCPRAEPWPSVASSCKGCVHVRFRYIALKLKARWGSAWVIQNPSYCGGPVRLVSLLQGLNGLRRFINVSELRQRVAVQATLFQKTTVPCMDWDVLSGGRRLCPTISYLDPHHSHSCVIFTGPS